MPEPVYISVILPLKLRWVPSYRVDLPEEGGAAVPVRGTRVSVRFHGRVYVGVVSAVGVTPEVGLSKVLPVEAVEDLPPVTEEELALWEFIADYYLCSVGEVYQAAYPSLRLKEEKVALRRKEAAALREVRQRDSLGARLASLELRSDKKRAQISRLKPTGKKYEQNKQLYENQLQVLLEQIDKVRSLLEALGHPSALASGSLRAFLPPESVPQLTPAQQKSKEEILAENEKKIADFNQGTIEITDKINRLKTYLREQEDEVYFTARDKSKECAKKIRAAIYKVIDGGVYDGPYLSSAFADIQEEETKDFMNDIIDMFMSIKFEVESKFDEIQSIEIENEITIHSTEFSSKSSTKWEKGFQIMANIGGGVVGALGASAGAAAIYSALGIAAASGPAGWVVAGVGMAIYGIFSLFGWGVKKVVQSDRADKTKRQISPKIDDIENSLLKAISEKYADFATSCTNSLDAILKYREEELVNLKKTLSRVVDDEQEVVLKNDLDYIINKQKEL